MYREKGKEGRRMNLKFKDYNEIRRFGVKNRIFVKKEKRYKRIED